MERSLSRRNLLSLAAVSSIALASQPASAQDPVEPPPSPSCPASRRHGLLGVAAGQLLRVSLFHDTDAAIPSSPCLYRIRVLGLDGKELGAAAGTIVPGTGAFADFDVATAVRSVKPQFSRVECYVQVDRPADHPLWATAEVFDAKTGTDRLVAPVDFPTPSEAGMGTVGVVDGQLARVSLFHVADANIPDAPCLYRIRLLALDGKVLALNEGTLMPGQGVAFDHDLASGHSNSPQSNGGGHSPRDPASGHKKSGRVQFHVHVDVEHPVRVSAALQLYDAWTGESAIGAVVIPCSY